MLFLQLLCSSRVQGPSCMWQLCNSTPVSSVAPPWIPGLWRQWVPIIPPATGVFEMQMDSRTPPETERLLSRSKIKRPICCCVSSLWLHCGFTKISVPFVTILSSAGVTEGFYPFFTAPQNLAVVGPSTWLMGISHAESSQWAAGGFSHYWKKT